jgi:cytochrome c oxidase assembly factor CtaG
MLALSLLAYGTGAFRMSPGQRRAIAPAWRIACYGGAVVTLCAALFSPLDALADHSFAWHMVQHLLLMLVAAPLLALANTHLVSLFTFPLRPRRSIGKVVASAPGVKGAASGRLSPFFAATLFVAGLWLWHAPRLYNAALADPGLHTLEHLTFLISSAVYWRMVTGAGDRRLDPPTAIVLTMVVGLQANLLAALILLAPRPAYSAYAANALIDQQIAGMLMLVPASIVFLIVTMVTIRKLFR